MWGGRWIIRNEWFIGELQEVWFSWIPLWSMWHGSIRHQRIRCWSHQVHKRNSHTNISNNHKDTYHQRKHSFSKRKQYIAIQCNIKMIQIKQALMEILAQTIKTLITKESIAHRRGTNIAIQCNLKWPWFSPLHYNFKKIFFYTHTMTVRKINFIQKLPSQVRYGLWSCIYIL